MNARSNVPDQGFWAETDDAVARRRYRDLVDSLDEGIFQFDSEGDFVAVNDAFVEATGHSRTDLVGAHVSVLFDPEDIERLERENPSRLASSDETIVELSVESAADGASPSVMQVALLPTVAGEGTLGIVRTDGGSLPSPPQGSTVPIDVLETIIEETEGAAFVLDEDFEIVWADASVGQFFGVDPEGLAGRDKRTVLDETLKWTVEDPEWFAERVQATYDDNTFVEEFECHVTAGDDREERWLEHWSKPITSGQYAGGRIECYTDVTDRRRSADALREAEQEVAALVDAVTEYAIIRLDPEGTVTNWNGGAREIKGYEASEILGESFTTFYSPEDRARGVPERNLREARDDGVIDDEGWRVRKDGSRFWATVTISAIDDEDGDHRGYLQITRDVTERHANQEGLES